MNAFINKFEGIPQELLVYIRKLEARVSELENVVKERDKAIIAIQNKYDSLEFNYSKLVREKYASKSEMFNANELHKATNDSSILNDDNKNDIPNKLTSGLKAEINFTRSGEVANEFFKDFTGYLQCDGYSGYNALRLKDNVTVVGCLAHVRRKFVDIIKNTKKPGKAVEAIRFMQQLYQIERQAKEMHPIERKYFRELRAKPILKSFKYWLAATKKVAPPKSPLGIAIGYALNQWEYLTNYLKDGRVSICNNWAENQIRPFALGRKNWGMHSSSRGARSSAVLYSLAITCKARKLDPYEYFLKVLTQAPYCKTREDWEKLVPG